MRILGITTAALMIGGAALADPNPQLIRTVQQGLNEYGVAADAARFDTATLARLHFVLSSSDAYFVKREELQEIVDRASGKE